MKIYFSIFLFLAQIAQAQELRNFNPEVLGKGGSDSVKLLLDATNAVIEPLIVEMELKNGKYDCATLIYPSPVTVERARESLNRLYKRFENADLVERNKFGVWRNTDQKCAIQLSKDDEGNVRLIFLAFRPANADFWKEVFKAKQMFEKNQSQKKSLRTPKDSK